jgi:hypothetical protein
MLFICLPVIASAQTFSKKIWLDDLDIAKYSERIAGVNAKMSAGSDSTRLGAASYTRGLGIHSSGILFFWWMVKLLIFRL